jgi:antitoxin HicB
MNSNHNHNLDYYLSLPYPIEIVPITQDEGGGFEAFIPQLGRMSLTGAGETPEDAIASLNKVKETVFSIWLNEGFPIPMPERKSPIPAIHR